MTKRYRAASDLARNSQVAHVGTHSRTGCHKSISAGRTHNANQAQSTSGRTGPVQLGQAVPSSPKLPQT